MPAADGGPTRWPVPSSSCLTCWIRVRPRSLPMPCTRPCQIRAITKTRSCLRAHRPLWRGIGLSPSSTCMDKGSKISSSINWAAQFPACTKANSIAASSKVAAGLSPTDAIKPVDVRGLYVTPGLIDLHTHNYTGTGERGSYAGDLSVWPDGFTFRTGVTTVIDAGCAGWRNFEDFKDRIIDRQKTRILAMLNIVGSGMRGGHFEQD